MSTLTTPFSINTPTLSLAPSLATPLNAADIEAVTGGDNVVVWNTDSTLISAP